jgi:regulator of protease activity HflC (stomatin/prohibitin superfamily)
VHGGHVRPIDPHEVAVGRGATRASRKRAPHARKRASPSTLPEVFFTARCHRSSLALQVSIQYQIKKEEAAMHSAYYRLSDPHRQIQAYVYDVVRSTVPKLDLDNVFLEKDEIAKQVAENLKENFGSFGYEILATPITAIEPAAEVKNAMNQINKARRVKEAAGDEGEAKKTRAIKDAEASARSIEIHAKADAEALYLAGVGLARQRQAIMSGLRESVNAFGREIEGIDPKQVLDLMIVTQYFDMMQSIGKESRSNALFLNHSPSSLADLTQSVSRGFMSR